MENDSIEEEWRDFYVLSYNTMWTNSSCSFKYTFLSLYYISIYSPLFLPLLLFFFFEKIKWKRIESFQNHSFSFSENVTSNGILWGRNTLFIPPYTFRYSFSSSPRYFSLTFSFIPRSFYSFLLFEGQTKKGEFEGENKRWFVKHMICLAQTVDSNLGLPPRTETREDLVNSIRAYSELDCGPRTGGVTLCCCWSLAMKEIRDPEWRICGVGIVWHEEEDCWDEVAKDISAYCKEGSTTSTVRFSVYGITASVRKEEETNRNMRHRKIWKNG